MGVDLDHRVKRKTRREPLSKDPQMKELHNLYKFLGRRTDSKFNNTIERRLCLSRSNRRPYSLSRLATAFGDKKDFDVAVVVGKIVNDERLLTVPAMKVCALKFSETARRRIVEAGGECLTFDQLALMAPKGENCKLLEGDRKRRAAVRHFGSAPGDDNSKARPKVRAHGRKFEMARGRRKSRLYRV